MVCEDGNQARVAGRYSSQRPVSHLPSLLWNTEYFYVPGHLLVNRATFHLKGLIDNKQIHMAVSSCWNEEKLSGRRMEGMRAWSSLKGRSRKASWSRWQWSQDLPPRRGAWHVSPPTRTFLSPLWFYSILILTAPYQCWPLRLRAQSHKTALHLDVNYK